MSLYVWRSAGTSGIYWLEQTADALTHWILSYFIPFLYFKYFKYHLLECTFTPYAWIEIRILKVEKNGYVSSQQLGLATVGHGRTTFALQSEEHVNFRSRLALKIWYWKQCWVRLTVVWIPAWVTDIAELYFW